MRLKPICASIILLGLSSSAFAVSNSNASVQAQLNSMQSQINQMELNISQNNGGTQSGGGTALQTRLASCPNWYDAISVSGLINVDGILASRSSTSINNDTATHYNAFQDNSASDLALDNADLFVDAQVNKWTKAHIGLNFQTVNNNFWAENGSQDTSNPKNFFDNSLIMKPLSNGLFDEAYVTFSNFCENPFYFRVGKQYLNFGNYDRFATVPTFTQLLSQTDEVAATLGFISNNFYGSVYGFRGIPDRTDINRSTFNIKNWGANLGWSQVSQGTTLNAQVGYLNNMADVDYVSESGAGAIGNRMLTQTGYISPVNAYSLDLTGSMGIFDAYAHYVSAINDFNLNDIAAVNNNFVAVTTRGANPSALTVGAGVTANIADHKSRFGLDYQYSWDALFVGVYGMPQARLEGTFDMNVSKNVNVGLYVYHDADYSPSQGGTGRTATTGVLHLGVMFA